MKLITILILVASLSASAKVKSQQISYSGKKVPLTKVLSAIKDQSGYVFFYTYGTLNKSKPVTLNVKDASLTEVLNLCFKDQPLTYKIEDKTILIKQKKRKSTDSPCCDCLSNTSCSSEFHTWDCYRFYWQPNCRNFCDD